MFHRRRPPNRIRARIAALVTALLLPLAALTALAAPAQAAGTLTATFTSQSNGSGWTGKYVVHNNGTAASDGWTLEFDLPPGVSVSGHLYGEATVSGRHVTVENA
ncbi:chitinase, partial [Streptomyces sp. SID5926]|nr:chitinase [Streptomyces sp. SID5926]